MQEVEEQNGVDLYAVCCLSCLTRRNTGWTGTTSAEREETLHLELTLINCMMDNRKPSSIAKH